jgi:hypothetical protein
MTRFYEKSDVGVHPQRHAYLQTAWHYIARNEAEESGRASINSLCADLVMLMTVHLS